MKPTLVTIEYRPAGLCRHCRQDIAEEVTGVVLTSWAIDEEGIGSRGVVRIRACDLESMIRLAKDRFPQLIDATTLQEKTTYDE